MPLEVNGTELSFILDSGVGKPILFNMSDKDSIQINDVSEITIRGLGEGEPIKALSSKNNSFKLGGIENTHQHLYVVMDKSLNFSPSLGMPVHGIIGYELFRDFIVDINYTKKVVKFYPQNEYHYKERKNSTVIPLKVRGKKAYVQASIFINEKEDVPVRMLVDTGSSDSIWLFEDDDIDVPEKNYEDYLGKGLGGDIFGKRTKVNGISLGGFSLKDAKAAFPDRKTFNNINNLGNRNGSIGGEVLKRFNVVFDYNNEKLFLKKNSNFNKPFLFNLSGIELQHDGVRYVSEKIASSNGIIENEESKTKFGSVQLLLENSTRLSLVPEIVVSAIRAGSPAHSAGLQEGDVILAVNGKRVYSYELQEIMHMLNEKEGMRIRLLIERYNEDVLFSFVLKNMLK